MTDITQYTEQLSATDLPNADEQLLDIPNIDKLKAAAQLTHKPRILLLG